MRIYQKNLCENTNIKSVFDLILNLAIQNNVKQEDMPENIIVISDMEFDYCARFDNNTNWWGRKAVDSQSEMERSLRFGKPMVIRCLILFFGMLKLDRITFQ